MQRANHCQIVDVLSLSSDEPLILPPDHEHVAVRAARILGLHVAGVDLLESADGPLVMEVNASPGLEKIRAQVLAINSADDERNPAELGILEREIKRVKDGRVFLIPASDQTAGHATAYFARFWKKEVSELLQTAPRLGK